MAFVGRSWQIREDTSADMGIGTLILFISMVLVAAITASLLISTVNDLQQQAQNTGQMALMDVSTGVGFISIIGDRHTDSNPAGANEVSIQVIEMRIKLIAGSDPLDLDNVVIQISDGSTIVDLTLNASGTTAAHADDTTFVADPIRDLGTAYEPTHMITSGDMIKLIVSTDLAATNLDLTVNSQISCKIQPLHGSAAITTFNTPSTYLARYVELK